MIEFFFGALSFLILARVIFSLIGYSYGPFYDFVFLWSEKILVPIRKRLPAGSRIDWSPFIALIIFDFLGTFLEPLISYLVDWQFEKIAVVLAYALLSTLSSITTFLIIIFIVRIVNDHVGAHNYALSGMLNAITEPLVSKVRHRLSFSWKNKAVFVTLGLLIALQITIQYLMQLL